MYSPSPSPTLTCRRIIIADMSLTPEEINRVFDKAWAERPNVIVDAAVPPDTILAVDFKAINDDLRQGVPFVDAIRAHAAKITL